MIYYARVKNSLQVEQEINNVVSQFLLKQQPDKRPSDTDEIFKVEIIVTPVEGN